MNTLNVSQHTGDASQSGATLIEVLVATLIMVTGVLAMAQMLSVSTASNLFARSQTVTAILAQQKIEELLATQSLAGTLSAGTLQRNTVGFVDYLDGSGRVVGSSDYAPSEAVYTRRWSVEPLVDGAASAVILQVLVTSRRKSDSADRESVDGLSGEARIAAIKAETAP